MASVFLYLDPQIPSTAQYRDFRHETPLRIYSADGALVGEFGDRRLIPIRIEDVPRHFIDGLVNTEDKRFYRHNGIDFASLANDVVGLVLNPGVRTGASTITMQLAKVVSFTHEQVFIRKFKEMLLALKVEQELGKEQILELYVNRMAFGKHAYGVQAAAHTYYGKPVAELSLAQLAMLAGIIKRPEAGNPINDPEWALARRNLVLRRMLAQGSIDDAQYREASAAPITARVFRRGIDLPAPYAAEWVRQEVVKRFGRDVYSGFVVHTTLDAKLQQAAQEAVRKGLMDYDRRHGYRGPEGGIEADADDRDAAAALAAYGVANGLEPAVVRRVGERDIQVLRGGGDAVEIGWDGMRWARPYLHVGLRGRTPRQAADIVAPGDVVRIERDVDGAWRLSQRPDIAGALIALDPRTGGVRALVGGWDFGASQFNHAVQAARQPGSGFKPIMYSAALEHGVTPASIFLDAPLVLEDPQQETGYRPRNDSGDFTGPMPLRRALYKSRNLVSMRVLMRIGEEARRAAGQPSTTSQDEMARSGAQAVIDHARGFGFLGEGMPRGTQLALGGGTMSYAPIDMARAYAAIANGGFLVDPHIVSRVERLDGTVVFAPRHPQACDPCPVAADSGATALPARRAIDERNAFVMHSMLRDVIRRGTGRRALTLNRKDIAGKTGTTDDAVDTWFNGYHPHLAASAWVGFADYRPTGPNEYGSKTPLSIWIDFMRVALADEPVAEPLIPAGVVSMKVAPDTGRIAEPGDPDAVFEYFFAGQTPGRDGSRAARRPDEQPDVRPEDIF